MVENLVFSQSAADEITSNLNSAITALGDASPFDPHYVTIGDPGVTGAACSMFIGLSLYTTNLTQGAQNLKALVEAAGESIGTFDSALEALAETEVTTEKKSPLGHDGGPGHPRISIDNPSQNLGTSTSTSHYHGEDSTSHETTHTPRTTETTETHETATDKSETTTTTHHDGSTKEVTTSEDQHGTNTTTVRHRADGTSTTTSITHDTDNGTSTVSTTNVGTNGHSVTTTVTTDADGHSHTETTEGGRGRGAQD